MHDIHIKYNGIVGKEVQLHSCLAWALHGGEWLTSHPSHFPPELEPSTHSTGQLMVPKGSLDDLQKRKISCTARIQSPDHPTCGLDTRLTILRLTLCIHVNIKAM